ncbi:transcriptional regulator [Qipengyuania nanhaisediminis]|uniref:transcriptional regulator n=1 Tax=Qipengyuania nanhaisediminis TaxID=604088 RepID=UPI0038B301C9
MNAPDKSWADQAKRSAPGEAGTVFDAAARRHFAVHYPEIPHRLEHRLGHHPLLERGALAELATSLPDTSVEYNRGDLPIGVDGKPEPTGRSIGATIRDIDGANSWAVLKNIEQVPAYRALLDALTGELAEPIRAATGDILTPQGFVFISSPLAVTPYHFDPEHNILLQVEGTKVMTQFPAGDPRFAPDAVHESYHCGGPRELAWDDGFMDSAREYALTPGEAVYVPVMAPHFVRNGPASSISLSITWRSAWSYRESEARAFNRMLRNFGLAPRAPRRWPATNRVKSLAFRALRKLGLTPRTPPA